MGPSSTYYPAEESIIYHFTNTWQVPLTWHTKYHHVSTPSACAAFGCTHYAPEMSVSVPLNLMGHIPSTKAPHGKQNLRLSVRYADIPFLSCTNFHTPSLLLWSWVVQTYITHCLTVWWGLLHQPRHPIRKETETPITSQLQQHPITYQVTQCVSSPVLSDASYMHQHIFSSVLHCRFYSINHNTCKRHEILQLSVNLTTPHSCYTPSHTQCPCSMVLSDASNKHQQ